MNNTGKKIIKEIELDLSIKLLILNLNFLLQEMIVIPLDKNFKWKFLNFNKKITISLIFLL